MYISTLEILGLSADSTPGQISAKLASPQPGTLSRAWENEIKERTTANGGDRDKAWNMACLGEAGLWGAYQNDCSSRLEQQMQQQAQGAARVKEGENLQPGQVASVVQAQGRRDAKSQGFDGASHLPPFARPFTANAASGDGTLTQLALDHFIGQCKAADLEQFRQMLAANPKTSIWLK